MKTHAERVKYVGLPSVTTLRYDQQVPSKQSNTKNDSKTQIHKIHKQVSGVI